MKDARSKSAATGENAMTADERDAFLAAPRLTRLSTIRSDGWAHTAPAWFLWAEGKFIHSIGSGRKHLRNLATNEHVTECIDIDERLAGGLEARAAAVICFGRAEIVADHEENVYWNREILAKYLPPADAARYLEFSVAEIDEGRRIVKVTADRWLSWDYGKV